jgi:hypothetical protein
MVGVQGRVRRRRVAVGRVAWHLMLQALHQPVARAFQCLDPDRTFLSQAPGQPRRGQATVWRIEVLGAKLDGLRRLRSQRTRQRRQPVGRNLELELDLGAGVRISHRVRRLKWQVVILACPAAMPFFWKPYTSDVTQFIDTLKAKKPTLEAEQRSGRALLWDRQIDRQAQREFKAARVPQQAYVYQNEPVQKLS